MGAIPGFISAMNNTLSRLFFCGLALAVPLNQEIMAADTLPTVKMKVAYPNLIFSRPMFLCESPDATHRVFVVEQDGRVWILPKEREGKEKQLFLDISDRRPHGGNEEGLLGFAFHPQFKSNGKFYVYYSQQNPRRSVFSEIQISKTGIRIDR